MAIRASNRVRIWALALAAWLVLWALPAAAQGTTLAAFVNPSGQLIVSDTSGSYRWIVTNPGETLANPIGFTWSPTGDRILFAVSAGPVISLRVGTVASQSVAEIGTLPAGAVSGGVWMADGSGVFAAANDQIIYFDAAGGGSAVLVAGGGSVTLISPYAAQRPYLDAGSSLSPDGQYLFYQGADGRYVVVGLDGSAIFALPGANEANAQGAGLWADTASLVAYWGYEATALLSVTNAATGATVTLDSGRSAPIMPLAWLPGTTTLLYRDATAFVRAADMSCLLGSCAANPLESGVEFMPPTASDVQVATAGGARYGLYHDSTGLYAVPADCVASGGCAGRTLLMTSSAAPDQPMHAENGVLAFTAFTQDPFNAADRAAAVLDLNCIAANGCTAQTIAQGALAGLVAPDGSSVIVDSAAGLNALNLRTGSASYLADYTGGSLRFAVRWN